VTLILRELHSPEAKAPYAYTKTLSTYAIYNLLAHGVQEKFARFRFCSYGMGH